MDATTAFIATLTILCVTFLIWTWIMAWHAKNK